MSLEQTDQVRSPDSEEFSSSVTPETDSVAISESQSVSQFEAAMKAVAEQVRLFQTDKRVIQEKRELSPGIFQAFGILLSCMEEANNQSLKIMLVYLVKNPEILELLYGFLSTVFQGLVGGLDPSLGQVLMFLHALIGEWTGQSLELAQYIVDKGLLMEHIDELCKMKDSSKNPEAIKLFVQMNLTTIYNCCCVTDGISRYFIAPEFDCVPIFEPYAKSEYRDISLIAKLILGSLSSILFEKELDEYLQLTEPAMDEFLASLQTALASGEHMVKCHDSIDFTVREALLSLNCLLGSSINREKIVERNIISTVIVATLNHGTPTEQEAGCQILWNLFNSKDEKLKTKLQLDVAKNQLPLDSLSQSEEKSLKLLSFCASYVMNATEEQGLSNFCEYAEGCYLYAYYSECVEICNQIIKSARKENQTEYQNVAKRLLGKSSFKLYQRIRFKLMKKGRLQLQYTQEYQIDIKKCAQLAQTTINTFGSFLDEGCRISNEELKMLDIAMCDQIVECHDPGRCLLYLQKRKLRKSHYFPKFLWEEFASGAPTPLNMRCFRSEREDSVAKSPKQLVYPMFCAHCENHLSRHGETQFGPNFFQQIYNRENPSLVANEQKIEYEDWLYQFCLGILFRGLAVQMRLHETFINNSQAYNVFKKCRDLISNIDLDNFPNSSPTASGTLKIGILISPMKPRPEDDGYPWMVRFLNNFMNYVDIQASLDSTVLSRPHQIHCFLVHFGIINILVPVISKESNHIPSEFFINPAGGELIVPSEKRRAEIIPTGIWCCFRCEALSLENYMLNRPEKIIKEYEASDFQQPSDVSKSLFQSVNSFETAVKTTGTHIKPSPNTNIVKVLNFLPNGFLVSSSSSSSVHLPSKHTVLVHKTFPIRDEFGETLIFAVGNSSPYSLEKPYIIYHRFEPGLQLHVGFFVSPETLEAQEYLPTLLPKEMKERIEWEIIENARSVCPTVIPQILNDKGILNYTVIKKRIQAYQTNLSEMPSYDMKCSHQFCWYCKSMCEVCMKPATFGTTVCQNDGTKLRFCGKSCELFNSKQASSAIQLQLTTWYPSESMPGNRFRAHKIDEGHNELLYMLAKGYLKSGDYCLINMTVVTGDNALCPKGRVYVVLYLRTLFEQQVIEFFLGDDLQPSSLLPYYTASPIASTMITRRKSTNEIKNLTFMALVSKGHTSLQELLQAFSV